MPKSSGYTLVTDTHDGAQGADGQFGVTVYQNVENQPLFPVAGSDTVAPTGWSLTPTESNSQRWKSLATFGGTTLTERAEATEITYAGTTAETTSFPDAAEITELGLVDGGSSGATPDPAAAEVTELTFTGTSANTSGGAPSFALEDGTTGVFFDAVTFGSGGSFPAWVAVGASGAIYTTSDLDLDGTSTWTAATVPNTRRVHDVAYDGMGRWLAVCAATGGVTQIWTATNPAGTWVQAGLTGLDSTDEGDEQMNGVTYGEDRWIVVGRDATILTAVDPTLDTDPTDDDSWRIVTRAIQSATPFEGFSSQGRAFYKVAWNGKTGTDALYTVVGQNDTGGSDPTDVGLLVTANDPTLVGGLTGWVKNIGHNFAGHFNDVAFATNSAGTEHWVISTGTSGVSSSVFVIEDPSDTTTSVWNDGLYGSNVGSDMRDITFHNNQWYVGSGSNTQSYMIGTYDTPSDPNGLSWSTGNTIGTTGQLRGVHSNGTDLVFGTANGVYLGSFPSTVGSMLTLIGDDSNFPNGAAMVEIGSDLNAQGMRDDLVTKINAIVADTMDNRIAGLAATPTPSQTERLDLTATVAGIKTNMLVDIDTTGATVSIQNITEGTDLDEEANQQTRITITGVSGDPFAGLTDRKAATTLDLETLQEKVGFGNQSGTDTWVAVGGREGLTAGGPGSIYTATDPDGTWTRNSTSPVDQATLHDVAYDGTRWIAVGDAIGSVATIITAIDATGTWVAIPAPHGVTSNPQSIIYVDDLSLWVMAGLGMWTSPDGLTWTQRYSTGFYFCVEYDADNGRFVAVGNGGVMASCTDPTVSGGATGWTAITSGVGDRLRVVAYHDGQWIAVGDAGGYTASTNGTDWTAVAFGTGLTETLTGVAFAIDRWLVCGLSGNMRESTDDGANWNIGFGQPTALALQWVSYEGDHLIITGGQANNDGLIFTPAEEATVFTIDGDNSEFINGPLTTTFTVGSDSESMIQQVFTLLDGNANLTGVDVYTLGNQLQIDSTIAGARTTQTSVTPFAGGATAAVGIIRQAGADGNTIFSTFTITADSAHHTPTSTITNSKLSGGFGAEDAMGEVRIQLLTLSQYATISVVQSKTVGSDTVYYVELVTSTAQAGDEDDLLFTVDNNGGSGDLVTDVDVTTPGAPGISDGSLDAYSVTINQTEYTGDFATDENAGEQATRVAGALTTAVASLMPIPFSAIASTTTIGLVTITALINGNQHNTLATLTQGEAGTDAEGSDATVTITSIVEGIGDPNWTIPVQDGFRGTVGVDGARGPGRFSNEFIITVADTVEIRPQISGSQFDTDARAAIVAALGAGANPADGDVVTITYQLTSTDPDVNGTYSTQSGLFDLPTVAWQSFALTIDGNLLVNGTIVGDKLLAGTVTSTQVNLFPQDVGAGGEANAMGNNSRMVILSNKIEIYEGSNLRVELGELS